MSMELAIEVKDLYKTFRTAGGKTFEAVRGLNMQVPRGSVYGFVGPNGAGKSTTIKALIGLVRPSKGEALVLGHPCGTVHARSAIGYLPEVAVYHEFMSADELLALHAGLAGIPRSEQADKCEKALQLVGLWERRKSRIREYSKGMKQRFGIAQALVGNPHLLILDELTSGLDPLAQAELRDIILQLKERGHTIFFSSHKMSEVEMVCDWVGIIHKGKMRLEGPKKDLLQSGHECRLHFKSASEPVEKLAGFEVKHDSTLGLWVLRAPREKGDEALEAVRNAGGSVVEFSVGKRSMEEIFLEIVHQPVPEELAA